MSRTTFAFVALATGLAVAGCGGDKPQATSSPSSTPPAAGSAIDACKLVSADDIAKLLGKPVEGRAIGGSPDAPACTWENRETYESVTVEIGNPGSAANGALPPPEPGFGEVGTPGPDGMRNLASGMVEFPAGGRANTVQVAVLALMGPDADNAAVDLARKIGPQLPQ
ncbi:hypothetical protein A5662_03300 [Mycobacteriaceae bacterium 1482268.1]|nr:hypothetical protein A5662_03300 [Mycobacteriaceae bacterium 1482268.1]